MVKVKDGKVEMTGSENQIFTDVVRTAESFCESFAELKDTSSTVMLCCLIEAVADQLDIDVKKVAQMINKMEGKNDD